MISHGPRKRVEVSENGYLVKFDDWDGDFVSDTLDEINKKLTIYHLLIIHFARTYYKRNGLPPSLIILQSGTGFPSGEILSLFTEKNDLVTKRLLDFKETFHKACGFPELKDPHSLYH